MAEEQSVVWGAVKGIAKIGLVIAAGIGIYLGATMGIQAAGYDDIATKMIGGSAVATGSSIAGIPQALAENASDLFSNIGEGISNLWNGESATAAKDAVSETASKVQDKVNDLIPGDDPKTISGEAAVDTPTVPEAAKIDYTDLKTAVEAFTKGDVSAEKLATAAETLKTALANDQYKAVLESVTADGGLKESFENAKNLSDALKGLDIDALKAMSPEDLTKKFSEVTQFLKDSDSLVHPFNEIADKVSQLRDATLADKTGDALKTEIANFDKNFKPLVDAADAYKTQLAGVNELLGNMGSAVKEIVDPGFTTQEKAIGAAALAGAGGAGYWAGRINSERENAQQPGNPYLG